MNERSINTLFGLVLDPIENVYDIKDRKKLSEIQRIVRIFNITEKQREMSGEISARALVAFKMLVSNN
ncbi:MAG: hypothetical protein LUE64_03610 [Candidatus Gastranaerophilales bacterium]|nr:hypothetical protein [Candidatus Gastranaerophilales bacterium]